VAPAGYRVNGVLHYLKAEVLSPQDTRAICSHLISDPRVRDQIDVLQEHETSYSVAGVARFRVNNLSAAQLAVRHPEDHAHRGPPLPSVGQGKSTTLAALLNHINIGLTKDWVRSCESPLLCFAE
jgi:Tfp pilus assembly pilus retraction ATPase PilT